MDADRWGLPRFRCRTPLTALGDISPRKESARRSRHQTQLHRFGGYWDPEIEKPWRMCLARVCLVPRRPRTTE